jgi:gliding motility-associated protein GldM
MSIPKEPRQLMINLMYLVLTAMLALNVSAEIINAFFAINKGLNSSNKIVESSNGIIQSSIDKQLKAYNTPENQGFKSKAVEATKISKEFEAYIGDVLGKLITAAGGIDDHYTDGRPKRYKDKDVTTNLFLKEGLGAQIEKKITETRNAFLALVPADKKKDFEKSIALMVDSISRDSKAANWPEYKFKQMPVAAVMPSLTKLISDAKTSETALLNFFLEKVGGDAIKIDKFLVALAPKKGYINRGEKFEAQVYLAGYSESAKGVSIQVNGQSLAVQNGIAQFSETGSSLGKRKITATASIVNPLTGKSETAAPAEFEYEVGESSATVSAEKMNVFYIGVTNPIAVSVAGVSSSQVNVSCENCNLSKVDANNYNVTVSQPANREAKVKISGGGINYAKTFRIKSIPDPVARLAASGTFTYGGAVPSGVFAASGGLLAELKNFDFDAKCSIQSFVLVHVPRREDPTQAANTGPVFSGDAARLASKAKPGDSYNVMAIKGRCPGDAAGRDLGSLSFMIR